MVWSLSLILICLGLLCFSGSFTVSVAVSVLWSVHLRLMASPDLAPVSFKVCMKVASWCLHPLMSWSISFSVGMKGIFSWVLYFGNWVVSIPCCFRNSVAALTPPCFVESVQLL